MAKLWSQVSVLARQRHCDESGFQMNIQSFKFFENEVASIMICRRLLRVDCRISEDDGIPEPQWVSSPMRKSEKTSTPEDTR